MIWLLFKNCRKKKNKTEYAVEADPSETSFREKIVLRDVLARLDALRPDDCGDGDDVDNDGGVYITDGHFDSLSVLGIRGSDRYHGTGAAGGAADRITVVSGPEDDPEDGLDEAPASTTRSTAKVSRKLLRTLQCPFTWAELGWDKNVVGRVQNKYGNYNAANIVSSAKFSFEKYVSGLVVCCGLFKANEPDRAHDRLTDIWRWLDRLDDANEPFYLTARDGLKHVVMSALCHVLYTTNKTQCQQLLEMITRFNAMDSKSRAAVYGIRSAVCIEFGGDALLKAVQYAKKARDLDADTAYWNYYRSVAMTAHRQYLDTCKSNPTEAEFDAIQHAIILSTEPNPYFNFHRMVLMKNKILYYYYVDSRNSVGSGNDTDDDNCVYINKKASNKIKQDFDNIVGLIKAIVVMEPDDPCLVVKCAVSLMTLPYFNQEIVHLVKQIISIAINIAPNDPSVNQAIKKSVEIYEELYDIYKELERKNEKEELLESVKTQNSIKVDTEIKEEKQEDDIMLENDFKSIVKKHKKQGSVPLMDLINLLDKFDGHNKWKIMAQICSYSIIFVDSSNLLNGVEQFMMLTQDRDIANSDIVTNHRSIFITDPSMVFNLAELVCNEIKLAITFGRTKDQDETQFYLDMLTEIMEVCQLKSKKANTAFITDLTAAERTKKKPKKPNTVSKPTTSQGSNKNNKPRRLKQNLKNNHTRTIIPKTKVYNNRKFKTSKG